MKEGWEIKRLGDVLQKTETINPLHQSEVFFKYIDVSSVDNLKLTITSTTTLKGKDAPSRARKLVRLNDVIFATVRPTLRRIAIIPDHLNCEICSTGYVVLRANNAVNYKLIYYYLQTETFISSMEKLQRGASYPAVTDGDVMMQIISFPNSPVEQQNLVFILDETFAIIDQAKENLQRNLQNVKELFQSELDSVFTKKSKGWAEKKLGEVLQRTETINPSNKPDKEFIYIDVSSVNKETLLIEETTSIKGKDAPSRARKAIQTNDVIFATVRPTLKRIAIIPDEYNEQVCSTGYFVLRASKIIHFKLLFYYLQTFYFQDKMEKLQKGASYPAVTDGEVKEQLISFPIDKREQVNIVKQLDDLSLETKKLEEKYQQKLNYLEGLKKSILQKAFSGELTNKIEIAV